MNRTDYQRWAQPTEKLIGYKPSMEEFERFRASGASLDEYADYRRWADRWAFIHGVAPEDPRLTYDRYRGMQLNPPDDPTHAYEGLQPALTVELEQHSEMWRFNAESRVRLTYYLYALVFAASAFALNFLSGRTNRLLNGTPDPGSLLIVLALELAMTLIGLLALLTYGALRQMGNAMSFHTRVLARLEDLLFGFPNKREFEPADAPRTALLQLPGDNAGLEGSWTLYRDKVAVPEPVQLATWVVFWLDVLLLLATSIYFGLYRALPALQAGALGDYWFLGLLCAISLLLPVALVGLYVWHLQMCIRWRWWKWRRANR